MSQSEIKIRISEYQNKISKFQFLLKKGCPNPSELRNAVIDCKIEINRLKKLMEVC